MIGSRIGGQSATRGQVQTGNAKRRQMNARLAIQIAHHAMRTAIRGRSTNSDSGGKTQGGYRKGWVAPGGDRNALAR
jgi:hypothetical protein